MEAIEMLEELREIPKLIQSLNDDVISVQNGLYRTARLSVDKVAGGKQIAQDDRIINNIDTIDRYQDTINNLLDRKEQIVSFIMRLDNMKEKRLLIVTYLNSQTLDEAIEKMQISRKLYFKIKSKAIENLGKLIAG
ncbi:DUF1492 domain-containing protein [Streptococcus saliviloxodontae]|uniref:DNA-directed RNA polymerase specialized sigma subunit n=1 Tax=Streptococcus saliviloxodontae TaxID=1349416 RepID=A0ABS2PJR0_9STRE|nr:DUF1492 domain-containing protein [Streptococcus saliviloxodontae]MBM7635576.1 DNA-directed RNA polymerase specialized sigma subunit [Streptococcus saliviloxodontae]